MINIYKPTPKNSGSACQVWYAHGEKAFFIEILKQHSWNAATRSGSFKASKDNPQKRVVTKFSTTEVCGILDAIDKNEEFKAYHDAPNSKFKTQVSFKPYVRDGKQIGYSLNVNKTNKEDTTPAGKASFLLGFTPAEVRLLKEYIVIGLNDLLRYRDPEEYKKLSAKKAARTKLNDSQEETTSEENAGANPVF